MFNRSSPSNHRRSIAAGVLAVVANVFVMSSSLGQESSQAAEHAATGHGHANSAAVSDQPSAPSPRAPGAFATPPASTERMAARLQEIWRTADPRKNRFRSDEQAVILRDLIGRTTPIPELLSLKPRYAQTLLESGQPDDALQEFNAFEQLIRDERLPIDPALLARLRLAQATCYLRIGEQDNCLTNHNAESCLWPIRGGGVHTARRGSQGAVEVLTALLQEHPDNLTARWLLNLAYMTLGEYPDAVPAAWLIKPEVFASEYDIKRFPDVAGPLGLDSDDLAGGVVMDDFDNDGLLDLLISAWGMHSPLRLFRNNGDGSFTERTRESALASLGGGLNLVQADYNNDGWMDVLVLRGAWFGREGRIPNSLLRNNGDFTFTDVTEEAGMLSFHPTQTAAWLDFNNDGWIDVFVGNESNPGDPNPCELFRNNGDGTFTECAREHGVALTVFVKAVTAGDFNNDGRADLFLSCRDGTQVLLRNDGPAGSDHSARAAWKFTDVTRAAGVAGPHPSFPCWFWDYNNDGWLDLLVVGYFIREVGDVASDYLGWPNHGQRARLYRNRGDGTFADVSEETGVAKVLLAMSGNFGDLDNDGWLDFYLGTGDPDLSTIIPNRMFRNAGGTRFQDVTTSGGFGQVQKGHGIAFGDLDNDGDQDVYSVVGGAVPADHYPNQLFANPGHGNHSLTLKLIGLKSNRSALGARLKVVVQTENGERAIHRTVGSGGSFGASPLRQEIGLGSAQGIDRVEIFWPTTGQTQVVRSLSLNSFYEIREGDPTPTRVARQTFELPDGRGSPDGQQHHHE